MDADISISGTALPPLVSTKAIVQAIFDRKTGAKVAFISRSLVDPLRCNALWQWGNTHWTNSKELAKRWEVGLVIGDPKWIEAQLAKPDNNAPEGIAIAFL